jgi:hypothetical protein
VFSAKRNLKNHKDNVFITENLTPRRRKIMDELNYLRVKRRIQACWSHDGRIFAIGVNSRSTDLIICIDDIYFMLDKYPENPSSADTELLNSRFMNCGSYFQNRTRVGYFSLP